MRVLIAEDEALIRMDLREMLEEEGHEVVAEARDGAEAIEFARSLGPDIIFMDINMPGVSGIEAAEVLGAERVAPVVMVTAFSQASYVEQAAAAGAMAYLVKPFTRTDILPAMALAAADRGVWGALGAQHGCVCDRQRAGDQSGTGGHAQRESGDHRRGQPAAHQRQPAGWVPGGQVQLPGDGDQLRPVRERAGTAAGLRSEPGQGGLSERFSAD